MYKEFTFGMEGGNDEYKFAEVNHGDLFQYNGKIYMKIYYSSNQNLMVDIKTGESSFLSPETTVNEVLFTTAFN